MYVVAVVDILISFNCNSKSKVQNQLSKSNFKFSPLGNVPGSFITTLDPVDFILLLESEYKKKTYMIPFSPAHTKFLNPHFLAFKDCLISL